MVSGPKNFIEHLNPILHRLIIHFHNHMLDDRWSDAFVGEGKSNGPIAAIELENRPDRSAHLLALHVSGVTGNTQGADSYKGRDHRVVSAGAARYLVLRHDDDGIASRICVNESGRGGLSEIVPGGRYPHPAQLDAGESVCSTTTEELRELQSLLRSRRVADLIRQRLFSQPIGPSWLLRVAPGVPARD